MKRLLLLFVLNCHALTLPSLNNPAIWNVEENWEIEKANIIAFRYSEPFENFHNGKIDFAWSDGHFLAAAGFGSSILDSIYRELEFSGNIGFKPFDFLSFAIAETANISWVSNNSSWHEHKISIRGTFFYKGWARISLLQKTHIISKTPLDFSGLFVCETNFSSLYSFGLELPIKEQNNADFRFFQKINLGYFDIYNSFAYPGPALGFGFIVNTSVFSVGTGHLRGLYQNGHTGFLGKF